MSLNKKKMATYIRFAIILAVALITLYPLIWMFSSSFKPEKEIFMNLRLIPETLTIQNYIEGWSAESRVSFTIYFKNSILLALLCVLGNILACSTAAYSFARNEYKLKNLFFVIMFATVMLPPHATLVAQYIYFHKLGLVDSIVPLVLPKFLGLDSFFIFLLVQFIRGIPRELDEAAIVDGCSKYTVFSKIILPLLTPALITTTIFTFIWTWNDFFTQSIYLSSPYKHTVSLALRSFIDPTNFTAFGPLFAMSILSIVPTMFLFTAFQKYLIEGIATSGLKG